MNWRVLTSHVVIGNIQSWDIKGVMIVINGGTWSEGLVSNMMLPHHIHGESTLSLNCVSLSYSPDWGNHPVLLAISHCSWLLLLSPRTCCKKEAWIRCKVMGISRAVEKFGLERYRKNAMKVCSVCTIYHLLVCLPFVLSPSDPRHSVGWSMSLDDSPQSHLNC